MQLPFIGAVDDAAEVKPCLFIDAEKMSTAGSQDDVNRRNQHVTVVDRRRTNYDSCGLGFL